MSLHGLAPSYLNNLNTVKGNSFSFSSPNQRLLNMARKTTAKKTLGDVISNAIKRHIFLNKFFVVDLKFLFLCLCDLGLSASLL